VDDENNMLIMLKKVLARNGIQIDAVNNASEALKMAENTTYDLAIIDISMKPMNGLELLEELRNIYPNFAAVMITAYPSDYSERRSFELGALGYITKPIELQNLNTVVNNVLYNGAA